MKLTIRPPHIINELVACFADLLETRARSPNADGPLIIILLLPRHLTTDETITAELQEINSKLKAVITAAREKHGINVTWIDTQHLTREVDFFHEDGKRLTLRGTGRLATDLSLIHI